MTRGISSPNFNFLPFSVRPRRPSENYRGEITERGAEPSRAEAILGEKDRERPILGEKDRERPREWTEGPGSP